MTSEAAHTLALMHERVDGDGYYVSSTASRDQLTACEQLVNQVKTHKECQTSPPQRQYKTTSNRPGLRCTIPLGPQIHVWYPVLYLNNFDPTHTTSEHQEAMQVLNEFNRQEEKASTNEGDDNTGQALPVDNADVKMPQIEITTKKKNSKHQTLRHSTRRCEQKSEVMKRDNSTDLKKRGRKENSAIVPSLTIEEVTLRVVCDICGKTYKNKGSLSTHYRLHTGAMPFSCEHCSRTFRDRSTYIKHLRVHSGEKPYICPICQKAFSQSGNMTRHLKIHKKA